ncbi:hypothetical protein BS47DRAFT_1393841 [Hydnum rufescens UP504]|uniref:Uncharacterized protein n=1 Tax=Hydnum rufescens UP504 TaxID=1448309 RepID=A0A9P6DT36_9AGAM|nr:hypothetical protein BS47DRAFT_1393841 [Hydnum rufescens UP504]
MFKAVTDSVSSVKETASAHKTPKAQESTSHTAYPRLPSTSMPSQDTRSQSGMQHRASARAQLGSWTEILVHLWQLCQQCEVPRHPNQHPVPVSLSPITTEISSLLRPLIVPILVHLCFLGLSKRAREQVAAMLARP